ncbi:MAG: peptidoglycan-binding protein [Clostridia bacterium]|nr:peptidoglycan-binding protein [Clostridia bacterium]MBQ6177879.1 peptidoglycan-binding protein [Bacteroidales bacterium]
MERRGCRRLLTAFLALLLAVLLPLEAFATQQTGQVNTSSLILREKASKDSKALQTLSRGTKITITGSSGSWYRVVYGRYSGYVMKQYVKVTGGSSGGSGGGSNDKGGNNGKSDATKTLEQKLHAIGKPSPCAPGDTGGNVKKLQRCLAACGYYSGDFDGIYGNGTSYAVKRLQRAKHLSQTGVATKVTIAAMFGENTSGMSDAGVTERLDWFARGNTTIPKGAVFEVKDCRTGKTFTCKRWSGANHMDSMPLTKQDTAIMKSIYGGSWSWNRRPILVKYNGHVYAASMNGMPHGTTTITNNNFPGHFCIHFYGSKTHGTKRVDATHQNCVALAMHYSW